MKKRRRRPSHTHKRNSQINQLAAGRVHMLETQRRLGELLMQAVVTRGEATRDGTVIEAVAIPWFELIGRIELDPQFMHQIDWRKWEELVAGAYKASGFDEVILTPPSGDLGRDVIATKHGVLSVRIIGQMKKYKPGHLVTAEEVRAMLGVVSADQEASKGVITTTSDFAPRIAEDALIAPHLPSRLELISGAQLRMWLVDLARRKEQ